MVYFRHASAETGHDEKSSTEPGWWKSSDPCLTRQLDAGGWQQGWALGQAFRDLDLEVDHVVTSEFRRAVDTAAAMDLGPPEPTPDLTPLVYDPETLPERIEGRLNRPPAPGTITVLVAHGHVTERFEPLHEGDAAVFQPGQEEAHFLGYVPYEQWLCWAQSGAARPVSELSQSPAA